MRDDTDRIQGAKLDCPASKSRWKPNTQQLCLLEQHFKSGIFSSTVTGTLLGFFMVV